MITYVLTNAHKIKIIKCYQKYPFSMWSCSLFSYYLFIYLFILLYFMYLSIYLFNVFYPIFISLLTSTNMDVKKSLNYGELPMNFLHGKPNCPL